MKRYCEKKNEKESNSILIANECTTQTHGHQANENVK
jgi:hypothetical protein